ALPMSWRALMAIPPLPACPKVGRRTGFCQCIPMRGLRTRPRRLGNRAKLVGQLAERGDYDPDILAWVSHFECGRRTANNSSRLIWVDAFSKSMREPMCQDLHQVAHLSSH